MKGGTIIPRRTYALLISLGALLLSLSIVSCSSPTAREPSAESFIEPSAIVSPSPLPSSTAKQHGDTLIQNPDTPAPSASANANPKPAQSSSSNEQPTVSESVVEVSSAPPKSTGATPPADSPFQPRSPSLAGIKLGAADKDVEKLFGLPDETYPLPGEEQVVQIWEYKGFSIGFDDTDQVVYVEISSTHIPTGIQGLLNGMDGSQAAKLLGIPNDTQSNVLTLEVAGGWFKLDLDPDTRQVLSFKLINRKI